MFVSIPVDLRYLTNQYKYKEYRASLMIELIRAGLLLTGAVLLFVTDISTSIYKVKWQRS